MLRLANGVLLLVGLALALSSCREDRPPVIEICIGDGYGGADCILKDGTTAYKTPSQLQNYWMTSQYDMAEFSGWCYKANPKIIEEQMRRITNVATGGIPERQ
jgi:hypothetical protein